MSINVASSTPKISFGEARPWTATDKRTLDAALSETYPLAEWLGTLLSDLKSSSAISDYQTIATFQGLSQESRAAIAANIIFNLDINANDISLPQGKLSLAAARDQVAEFCLHLNAHQIMAHDWSAQELLLLVYSARSSIAAKEAGPSAPASPVSQLIIPPPIHSTALVAGIEIQNNSIVLGEGDSQVTFTFPRGLPETPELLSPLTEAYYAISRLADLTGQSIPQVEIRPDLHNTDSAFCYQNGLIQIGLNNDLPRIEHITAHEMGHHIFNTLISSQPDLASEFNSLFALYQANDAFELADDSNFISSADSLGHPSENPSELFSSFCAAFFLHPEELAAFINDPETPAGIRQAGIAMWSFMRDQVFNGQVFAAADPFAGQTTPLT